MALSPGQSTHSSLSLARLHIVTTEKRKIYSIVQENVCNTDLDILQHDKVRVAAEPVVEEVLANININTEEYAR